MSARRVQPEEACGQLCRRAACIPTAPTRMVRETANMEFVIDASTETEALLLEANLIKRLRPRFNVLLRDDKILSLYP